MATLSHAITALVAEPSAQNSRRFSEALTNTQLGVIALGQVPEVGGWVTTGPDRMIRLGSITHDGKRFILERAQIPSCSAR